MGIKVHEHYAHHIEEGGSEVEIFSGYDPEANEPAVAIVIDGSTFLRMSPKETRDFACSLISSAHSAETSTALDTLIRAALLSDDAPEEAAEKCVAAFWVIRDQVAETGLGLSTDELRELREQVTPATQVV